MQIEVRVTGKSCHGSMPWEGKNPLEWGAPIVAEAAKRYDARDGFLDHPFLGHGTRTASWARLDTPSDCAVPERFVFRFDRRLTIGETPEKAVADVEGLPGVAAARAAGLTVEVTVRRTTSRRGRASSSTTRRSTWAGSRPRSTRRSGPPSRRTAASSRRTSRTAAQRGALRKEPRVDRWIFSTDGVGLPGADGRHVDRRRRRAKRWVMSGAVKHPAMLGIGPGIEQNTHKIGECVDLREVVARDRAPRPLPERVRGGRRLGDDARRGAREAVHDGAADAAARDREREKLGPPAPRAQRGEEVARDLLGGRAERQDERLWMRSRVGKKRRFS